MKLKAPPGTTRVKTPRRNYPVVDGLIEVDVGDPFLAFFLARGFAAAEAPGSGQPLDDVCQDAPGARRPSENCGLKTENPEKAQPKKRRTHND